MKCSKCRTDNPDTARFCTGCGMRFGPAATPLRDPLTRTLSAQREKLGRGTLFAGRYEVIESLGAGGMGEVYRVEDKKIGQEVALKLIRPEIAAAEDTIERFRRELTTTREGLVIGTPEYMSPEQAEARRRTGARTSIPSGSSSMKW